MLDDWHKNTCETRDDVNHWLGRMGDEMTTCRNCGRATPKREWQAAMAAAYPMTPAKLAETPSATTTARYVVACIGCGTDVPEHRAKPVKRFCGNCTPKAPKRKDEPDELFTRRYRA